MGETKTQKEVKKIIRQYEQGRSKLDQMKDFLRSIGRLPEEESSSEVLSKCPNCKEPLRWKGEDGSVSEVSLPTSYSVAHERVFTYCPYCRKPLDPFGIDPEKRKLSKNSSKVLNRLRRSSV